MQTQRYTVQKRSPKTSGKQKAKTCGRNKFSEEALDAAFLERFVVRSVFGIICFRHRFWNDFSQPSSRQRFGNDLSHAAFLKLLETVCTNQRPWKDLLHAAYVELFISSRVFQRFVVHSAFATICARQLLLNDSSPSTFLERFVL